MSVHIAFDLTRLFIGSMTPTPRGIDRVELSYAHHFFELWRGDCCGILPTPWGMRWFNRDRSLRVINFIEDLWGEADDPASDPAYDWLKARLMGMPPANSLPKHKSAAVRLSAGFARFVAQAGLSFGHPVAALPSGTVYLNTGQITLAVPSFLKWLSLRPDVRPVFMLHDAIPIENPEYTPARSSRSHRQMVASTARYAHRLIVTTDAAGESIRRALSSCSRADIAVAAVPLPVPPLFLKPTEPDGDLRGCPYFVICGAIDPRKNHLLLLNIWRELVGTDGPAAPKLVLVGSRWHTSDAVVNMLERCMVIQDHVIEVAGLTTPALRQLVTGARAVLMPSFAEGFGIPIIEALAQRTPVIASDLASHREVGGKHVTYLSPIDGLGWLSAIRAHTKSDLDDRYGPRALVATYRPWTSAEYFCRIEPFILNDQL
jgi:glycosyltransferase involved in cell wall biosynthesis